MKYVAHDRSRYVCYLSDNGIRRTMLGCAHDTPRQAVSHTVPVYVSPTRSVERSSVIPALPPAGKVGGPRSTEGPAWTPATSSPVAASPSTGDQLGL